MSVLQTLLQRAHVLILPLESTFVAHHGPFPSLLDTHPLYCLPLCLKGNRQFSVTPLLLPKFLPWPAALHTTNSPEERIKSKHYKTNIIKYTYIMKLIVYAYIVQISEVI